MFQTDQPLVPVAQTTSFGDASAHSVASKKKSRLFTIYFNKPMKSRM